MDYYPSVANEPTPCIIERRPVSGASPLLRYATQFMALDNEGAVPAVGGDLPSASGALAGLESVRASSTTALHDPILEPRRTEVLSVGSDSEVAVLSRRRIALMAARNATLNVSVEILARLDILNERMRRQSPRVTEGHIATLEAATELAEQVEERRRLRALRRENRG